jgi:hypothetical protein
MCVSDRIMKDVNVRYCPADVPPEEAEEEEDGEKAEGEEEGVLPAAAVTAGQPDPLALANAIAAAIAPVAVTTLANFPAKLADSVGRRKEWTDLKDAAGWTALNHALRELKGQKEDLANNG